ncbi:hypothetical protein F4779DRAFT_631128 [Xylariaceae sp. FL0662B]|nr:hypothetical protein F4779DRAFT_631128 [Xylariaceae sp. FL0662B]
MSINYLSAPVLLAGFCIWDTVERTISSRNASRYRPFPLPAPEDRCFNTTDVSIIVPTVDWDDTFPDFLCRWLANNPGEVIIVTTEGAAAARARAIVDSDAVQEAIISTTIQVLTVKRPNKRDQLCRGINGATGQVIALVDDDAYWTGTTVLTHLLAPFQQADIGLVGGPITSYVPPERQNGRSITPWEVAALRIRQRRGGSMKAAYVADGATNFTVSGLTMLVRAEIVKDPSFQYMFAEETFLGRRQNTGDDAFITRWVLFQHHFGHHRGVDLSPPKRWRLGMQITPEAEVSTTIMTDSRYASQLRRWYRTGLRFRLTCLFYEPGFLQMRQTTPYMARKMAEGLVNPLLVIARLIVWWNTLYVCPYFAWFVLAFEFYMWVAALVRFARAFPYCLRKIYAAIIIDRLYLISDWYCWLTLGVESWSTRVSTDKLYD